MPSSSTDDSCISCHVEGMHNEGKPLWSKDWPTEPGYYWFYGWCWRGWRDDHTPELHYVEVALDSTGKPMYITNGHFLYKAEGADGFWLPVKLPELPVQK